MSYKKQIKDSIIIFLLTLFVIVSIAGWFNLMSITFRYGFRKGCTISQKIWGKTIDKLE